MRALYRQEGYVDIAVAVAVQPDLLADDSWRHANPPRASVHAHLSRTAIREAVQPSVATTTAKAKQARWLDSVGVQQRSRAPKTTWCVCVGVSRARGWPAQQFALACDAELGDISLRMSSSVSFGLHGGAMSSDDTQVRPGSQAAAAQKHQRAPASVQTLVCVLHSQYGGGMEAAGRAQAGRDRV
jgi:hypothetical protein